MVLQFLRAPVIDEQNAMVINKQAEKKKKSTSRTLSNLIKNISDKWRQMGTGKKGDRIDYYGQLYFWHDLDSHNTS